MKKYMFLFFSIASYAFDPIPVQEPAINKEIIEAHQRIHKAMSKVDDIEKKIQAVEQRIYQAQPNTDTKPFKAFLHQLQAEMKEAKEEATKARNHLNDLQHKQEDRQTELSQE